MANILDKEIKLAKKKFQIMTRKTYPKGIALYFLKRDGRGKPFTVLAKFDYFGVQVDNFRHSQYIEVGVGLSEQITFDGATRSMKQIAGMTTHLANVLPSGESQVFATRDGEDLVPIWINATYRFYVKEVSDNFVLADNLST
jgi:hypothetical protein